MTTGHQSVAHGSVTPRTADAARALNITAWVSSTTSTERLSDGLQNLGTLPVGGRRRLDADGLHFRDARQTDESELTYRVQLTYEDLAGAQYRSDLYFAVEDRPHITPRRRRVRSATSMCRCRP